MRDDVLLDGAMLRDGLRAFAKNGCMRIVLVEPSAAGRTALSARLGDLGIEVAPFGDPHVAFLFLLGRLDQVDGVLVNGDDEIRTGRLLARLEMLVGSQNSSATSDRHIVSDEAAHQDASRQRYRW